MNVKELNKSKIHVVNLSTTPLFVNSLLTEYRPHKKSKYPRHSKGKNMTIAKTTKYAYRFLAGAIAYALFVAFIIGVFASPSKAQETNVCDITATINDNQILTITHLSPLPGPGVVTVNDVVYRNWVGDGKGNMVIVVDVSGMDQVTIARDVPPSGGECVIVIPLNEELDSPECNIPSRWGHRLSDRCGDNCGRAVREWAHAKHYKHKANNHSRINRR